ncbi:MAG: SprT family zinc-dependent metalloprotease [bacterium]
MLEVNYFVNFSQRAKRLSLKIEKTGKIVVTQPKKTPTHIVEKFLNENLSWIKSRLQKIKEAKHIEEPNLGLNSRQKHLLAAKKNITSKVIDWNKQLNFHYNKITIKNQSSRWGSCSTKKNLNFNYKLNLIDESLLDYVVIHELCHLQEMNHGPRFWNLVASIMPDYKQRRSELKKIIID